MISALEIDLTVDLRPFAQYLRESGVPHRITQEGLKQVVWVPTPAHAASVADLFEDFNMGNLPPIQTRPSPSPGFNILAVGFRFPLTVTIIFLNLVVFIITQYFDSTGSIFRFMLFADFRIEDRLAYFDSLTDTIIKSEYWRLLTPMFLHFGLLHLAFNMLWVWEVGRRIERLNGASTLLLVTLISSLVANLFQYSISGPSFFGGMSGVVFGFFGYAFVWSQLVPGKSIGLSKGIYLVMLGYLVLGFTGIFSLLGLGSLANGAHLGGLVGGLVIGAIAGFLFRRKEEVP